MKKKLAIGGNRYFICVTQAYDHPASPYDHPQMTEFIDCHLSHNNGQAVSYKRDTSSPAESECIAQNVQSEFELDQLSDIVSVCDPDIDHVMKYH